jgi:hypothetical protein
LGACTFRCGSVIGRRTVREGAERAVIEAASQASRRRTSVGRPHRAILRAGLRNEDGDVFGREGSIVNLPWTASGGEK